MISGSICGGSEALNSDLFLYSNMFLAMGDVAAATALSLAAATPMGFMAGCLLFTLAYVATIESISLIALYQYTGDDAIRLVDKKALK